MLDYKRINEKEFKTFIFNHQHNIINVDTAYCQSVNQRLLGKNTVCISLNKLTKHINSNYTTYTAFSSRINNILLICLIFGDILVDTPYLKLILSV